MLRRFKNILDTDFDSFDKKELFVAISGGRDSMTLANLLQKLDISFTILHCNFQLRIPDADLDEAFVRNFASENKLPLFVKNFDTKSISLSEKTTIQETARTLRYDWFRSFLTDDSKLLLTAHHQDDNHETFFINLLRGTSAKGLAGIPYSENQIARPLLKFSQAEIQTFAEENKIEFRQDLSNFETKYTRNKLRINILPELKEIAPTLNQKLSLTMNSINDIHQWIQKQAKQFFTDNFKHNSYEWEVDLQKILDLDPIFIEYLFTDFDIHRSNLNEFHKFLKCKTGSVFYTNSTTFLINRNQLHFQNKVENIQINPTVIATIPAHVTLGNSKISISEIDKKDVNFGKDKIFMDADLVKLPLKIRLWEIGDRIQPMGMQGSKLVSDLLIDSKFSVFEKQRTLILEDCDGLILSVIGHTVSEAVKISEATEKVVCLVRCAHRS